MLQLSLVPATEGNELFYRAEGTNCAIKIEEDPKNDWSIIITSDDETKLKLRFLAQYSEIEFLLPESSNANADP